MARLAHVWGEGLRWLIIEASGRNYSLDAAPLYSSILDPHGPRNQRSPGFIEPWNHRRTGPSEKMIGRPGFAVPPTSQVPDHGVSAAGTSRADGD
jgi:hypothetical protein